MDTKTKKNKEQAFRDQMQIINKLGKGMNKTNLSKEYETNESTIAIIFQNRCLILNNMLDWYMASLRKSKYYAFHMAVLIYFRQAIAFNQKLTGAILKAKAKSLAKRLGMNDLNINSNWLSKFKIKYSINFSTLLCFYKSENQPIIGHFLTDSEIVQKAILLEKEEIFLNNIFIKEKQYEFKYEYKPLGEEWEPEEICYSINANNKKQVIECTGDDDTDEKRSEKVIDALQTIDNILSRFDILPVNVINALSLIEIFIKDLMKK